MRYHKYSPNAPTVQPAANEADRAANMYGWARAHRLPSLTIGLSRSAIMKTINAVN